ncbi:unnamed protein product [Leptidea sinapis]|uniref:Kinesin motor domain-containing protein n=1 Tax=Leptidea sinapis TaxID=189913 RepID=A0A5E4R2A7_9NEOP|nr:unnamed protein product [Leptidea sinapis]
MPGNIKVVVRVRPTNEKEKDQNNRIVVDVVDDHVVVFDPKEDPPFYFHGAKQPIPKRANKDLKFVFDHVYTHDATNYDIFETTTKEMLSSLMEGYNCSVFAYGATGAGKTYTMIGSKEHPGITYLTMEHLFYSINSFEQDREFDARVSYIEVYNENVYDLLKPSSTPLQIREDSKYGVTVAGLTLNNIRTARELLNVLEDGNKNRKQQPTEANPDSSRSHAVFQVYIKMKFKTRVQIRMKLSMIDLAGSERASATASIGERLSESTSINKSLLSLGNCINKLAAGIAYIPYSCKKNIVDGNMKLSQYVKITEELKKKVKELEAKLSLSSVTAMKKLDLNWDKRKREWRSRIESEELAFGVLEERLLSVMRQQRVLALRQRLRKLTFSHVAELAHRSSFESINQTITEDLPRHNRITEHYAKHSALLEATLMKIWTEWDTSRKRLKQLYDAALAEFPDLMDFVEKLKQKSEVRHVKASDELSYRLLSIENQELSAVTDYNSEMIALVKKLYLTLKGYDKAPPSLTAEYTELMKKAAAAEKISWLDDEIENKKDIKYFSSVDIKKPSISLDCFEDLSKILDIKTKSYDLRNIENLEPLNTLQGTIELQNNESIIIMNDSPEIINSEKAFNIPKKKTKEMNTVNVENLDIDNKKLPLVMTNKMEVWIKPTAKVQPTALSTKRELNDKTETFDKQQNRAKILKPVVGRAIPMRRHAAQPAKPVGGFGSTVSRDCTSVTRTIQAKKLTANQRNAAVNERSVGLKALRARERIQSHPYSRPTASNTSKRLNSHNKENNNN